jgi:SNF2 family DNA or RNA helicase
VVTNAIYQSQIFWEVTLFCRALQSSNTKKKQDENSLELKKLVSPFILRRTKEQVLKDLLEPRASFHCDMEPEQNYMKKKNQKREMLFKTDGSWQTKSTLSII